MCHRTPEASCIGGKLLATGSVRLNLMSRSIQGILQTQLVRTLFDTFLMVWASLMLCRP